MSKLKLNAIKRDFSIYYNTDYADGNEDSSANRSVRQTLEDHILHCGEGGDSEGFVEGLLFLLENIGCQEDLAMYLDFKERLNALLLINENDLKRLEESMPVNRHR
jgi:hypothetical protein